MNRAKILWFTGISGSGKSTIAEKLAKNLTKHNKKVLVLDGDVLRTSIHKKFDFSPEGIKGNNIEIVKLCKKHVEEYDYILIAVIAPFAESRRYARKELGDSYVEIYVEASLDTVMKRDVKGLYQKAFKGEIENFIGISPNVPYQSPRYPHFIVHTERERIDESLNRVLDYLNLEGDTKHRKIIATVGPTSFNENTIKKMDEAGVDVFRINMSHTNMEDIEVSLKKLLTLTNKTVCVDTEGAQLRTGILPSVSLEIKAGQVIELVSVNNENISPDQIVLSLDKPGELLKEGDLLKIDFNAIVVQVINIKSESSILARVIRGGQVLSNKGIGLDRQVKLPVFSNKDLKAFEIAKRYGVKTIALSYTSSGADVIQLRKIFDYEIRVICKIESKVGIRNLDSICRECDEILVDRGDLSREIPLEKIIFAQTYIMKKVQDLNKLVYIATNLMENMIENSKPTRAEIHDIISTLEQGADGVVLAAETAIGKYPVEAVRIMARIISEYDNNYDKTEISYITSLVSDRLIAPHGGKLIQQHVINVDSLDLPDMPFIEVNDNILSDITQIAEGIYSPLTGFMNLIELQSVLSDYKMPSGISWTLPILFQVSADKVKSLPVKGEVAAKRAKDGQIYAVLKIGKIEKIDSMEKVAKDWFGTTDKEHPGVNNFLAAGEYIVSGQPYLIKKAIVSNTHYYELVPRQTREIFNDFGWHHIVGFHTRNVIHRGHEYVQRRSLEISNADAILISPVVGKKKGGDFTAMAIVETYRVMIENKYYAPYGVLLGTFDTYSRYSGPREAVFTALCRKNFGCDYFIIGRDHTGVGDYYTPDASQKIFDKVDTGMQILTFDPAYYCEKCGKVTDNCGHDDKDKKSLSGTRIRQCIVENIKIDEFLMRPDVAQALQHIYNKFPDDTIES